ncbi:MAG: hypothetical protein FWH18_07605 [Marinilabiliaceae bacterium]|nr:hypothetical protein [Marinilabiliaceae bacterium]
MNAENLAKIALPQPINKGEIVLYHPDFSFTYFSTNIVFLSECFLSYSLIHLLKDFLRI